MTRTELLTFLRDQIIARKREGRAFKVGIDGRCAAGKTMLADELGRVLSARGFDVLRPEAVADVVIDNRDVDNPHILKPA